MHRNKLKLCSVLVAAVSLLSSCSDAPQDNPATSQSQERRSAAVTASAYNSLPMQTQGDPAIGAWGDRLKPGMKAIAVSRDLIEQGLTRGVKVRIEGLRGTYKVLDKMHARWDRKIDIYMGKDVEAARNWGKKKVMIYWK